MNKNITKKPPKLFKYKEEHPAVSFILNKEPKEALYILKGNKSYGQTMKQIIEDKIDQELAKKIKEKDDEILRLNKQLEFQRRIQRFELPCGRCGQPMKFSNNSEQWDKEIYPILRKAFITWAHPGNCPEEEFLPTATGRISSLRLYFQTTPKMIPIISQIGIDRAKPQKRPVIVFNATAVFLAPKARSILIRMSSVLKGLVT